MNAILGYSQLMQRDRALQPEQRKNLEIIDRSGEHLLALIKDVLEISRIEARQIRLEIVTFDLHVLLCDLERLRDFRFEKPSTEKRRWIFFNSGARISSGWTYACR